MPMNRTTYRVATRQYDGGEYMPHEDVLMHLTTAQTLAKAMAAENLTMVRAQDEHGTVFATYGDEVEFDRLSALLTASRRKHEAETLGPRWRVVLDMGLQYHTAYVRAHNSIGAMNAAEALTVTGDGVKRGVAVLGQATLALDQGGPIDTLDPLQRRAKAALPEVEHCPHCDVAHTPGATHCMHCAGSMAGAR